MELKDYGRQPFAVDLEEFTASNNNFRTAVWTGEEMQMTLMSIEVGGDIGAEIHSENDQFLRIEAGKGRIQIGESEENITFEKDVEADFGIFIPKGKWHNLINTGNQPIKLYSIYAPAHHPFGTVHATRAEADEAEEHEHNH